MANVSRQDIDALVALFQDSTWNEMHLAFGDTELFLSKDVNAAMPMSDAVSVPAPSAKLPETAHRGTVEARPVEAFNTEKSAGRVPEGWIVVRAPSLGTFYRAPKPGADPFCSEGDRVSADDELCLVEVMKLFTTVRAGISGIVREIRVADGDMVEFDQPLFVIEPDG